MDSSGWIEVFTNGPQSERFLEVLQDESSLIVPSITIFEVRSLPASLIPLAGSDPTVSWVFHQVCWYPN